jgi:hypothetical protein
MGNNNTANRWSHDRIYINAIELVGEQLADLLRISRILQDEGALKILTAVQAGRQLEMARQKGAGRRE